MTIFPATFGLQFRAGAMDWTNLAEDRDKWLIHANVVINFRFHAIRRISWLAEKLLDSQEGLCCVDLVVYLLNLFRVCLSVTLCLLARYRLVTGPAGARSFFIILTTKTKAKRTEYEVRVVSHTCWEIPASACNELRYISGCQGLPNKPVQLLAGLSPRRPGF
jgi:hypothetical protein